MTRRIRERARKEDVDEISALYCDIDYGKEGHKKESYFKTYEDARKCIENYQYPPSIIIHTGHGFHLYWLLKDTIKVSPHIEGVLKHITESLHGDPSATKINQVLRMPLTHNTKDGTKPKYVEMEKYEPDLRYILQINCPSGYEQPNCADAVIPAQVKILTESDVVALRIPDETKKLIETGHIEGSRFTSRSEADQSVIYQLTKVGYKEDVVKGIFSNREFGISKKYFEEIRRNNGEHYLLLSISKAKSFWEERENKIGGFLCKKQSYANVAGRSMSL